MTSESGIEQINLPIVKISSPIQDRLEPPPLSPVRQTLSTSHKSLISPARRPITPPDRSLNHSETKDPTTVSTNHNTSILANPSLRSSTVLNPNFLKSYFEQSRLHHLSAWKADLKSQMQQLTMSQGPTRKRTADQPRIIMHVDFDCFFCSVNLISRPELVEKPVCVGHGGGQSGEIASCNYVARKFGVHNGMLYVPYTYLQGVNGSMASALELCPDLICLPYDFPAYEDASRGFYEILLSLNADALQAVSVDEALLDITSIYTDTLAEEIRAQVKQKTKCDVSIGMGENILLAKLALRKAKPAGQYFLKSTEIFEFMQPLNVRDLPGVGWKLSEKLEEVLNVHTIADLYTKSQMELKAKFGPKTGEKLYNFARGIDDSEVGDIVQRKSVSVEVSV